MSAQVRWIDIVPALNVACLKGAGDPVAANFPKTLRENAKAAGATEVGVPFLTEVVLSVDGSSIVQWSACAVYAGPVKSQDGFTLRTMPATPAAIEACLGQDTSQCATDLTNWIKTKVPDFSGTARIMPIWDIPGGQLDAVKPTFDSLLTRTFILDRASPQTQPTKQQDELDKQLAGTSQTPRPLLVTSGTQDPSGTENGKEQPPVGVVVYLPLTDSQTTSLKSP